MSLSIHPGLVVVVDDIEGNRLLAQTYLQRIGWTVVCLDHAQAALDYLEHTLPEAMLLDVCMPGFNGDLLATILRAQPHTQGIRLVGYTAHAMPDEVRTLRACGFDEVLIKPVLLAAMREALPRPLAAAAAA